MFKINKIINREFESLTVAKLFVDVDFNNKDFVYSYISNLYKNKPDCTIYDIDRVKYTLICKLDREKGSVLSIIVNVSDEKRFSSVLTLKVNNKRKIIDSINIKLTGDCFVEASTTLLSHINLSENHDNLSVLEIIEEVKKNSLNKLESLVSINSTEELYENISNVLIKEFQCILPFNKISVCRNPSKSKNGISRKHRLLNIDFRYKNSTFNAFFVPFTINITKDNNSIDNIYRFKNIDIEIPYYSYMTIKQFESIALKRYFNIAN